jgi:hypothetical protein
MVSPFFAASLPLHCRFISYPNEAANGQNTKSSRVLEKSQTQKRPFLPQK